MSWYLNQHNDFIDGIQEFNESGGNISIINTGTQENANLGFNSTIADFLELKFENNVFNLYLKNINPNGSIFLKNDNTDIKVKIEDGKLFVYYDYNFLISATIISGWTDVADYLVGVKQATFNNITAIAVEAGNIITINGTLAILEPLVAGHSEAIIGITIQLGSHEARLEIIETQTLIRHQLNRLDFEDVSPFIQNGLTTVRGNISKGMSDTSSLLFTELLKRGQQGATQSILTALRGLSKSRFQLAFTIGQNIFFGGAITALIGLGYYAIDKLSRNLIEDDVNNSIKTLEYYKEDPKSQIEELLVVSGLQIDSTTNNDFLVSGTYEEIDTGNGGEITIKIDDNFSAIIISVEKGGTFVVNDVITISKSLLGGSLNGGDLIINVISVISFVEFLERQILEATNKILDIDNRQRRRQLIPDKNDFNNGFTITETTELQESGEELPKLDIALKLDTLQFEYDNSGNLQLIDFDKITTNTQDITDLETDFTNVYKVLMHTNTNYDNNTDYKLNIGYKEPFQGFSINLLCLAIQNIPSTFSGDDYNNDFLGYFPALTRLSDSTSINLIKSENIDIVSDFTFKKGLFYLRNIDQLQDYDLYKKFQFIIFLRPFNILNTDVEYTLIQSASYLDVDVYEIDSYKLKVFIKNNRLYISHNAKISWNIYAINTISRLETVWLTYYLSPPASLPEYSTNGSPDSSFAKVITFYNSRIEYQLGLKDLVNDMVLPTETNIVDLIQSFTGQNIMLSLGMLKGSTDNTVFTSSKLFYYQTVSLQEDVIQPENNFAKCYIKYKYEVYSYVSYDWNSFILADLDDLNLKMKFEFGEEDYPDQTLYRHFTLKGAYPPSQYFEQELFFPENNPDINNFNFKYVSLSVEPKDATLLPADSSVNFSSQIRIKIASIKYYGYELNPAVYTDEFIHTITTDTDVFPTPIDVNKFHNFCLKIDIPNNDINFTVDNITTNIDINQPLQYNDIISSPPDTIVRTVYPTFVSYNLPGLSLDNEFLVIGNNPYQGNLFFSHFNWRYFQSPTSTFITDEQLTKLDELIQYKYYHETVSIDRFLKVKEFYGDVVNFRKLLVNGGVVYNTLSPGEQQNNLRTEDQSSVNVLSTNVFVSIDKLFVNNPTISGSLTYDILTKSFNITEAEGIPVGTYVIPGDILDVVRTADIANFITLAEIPSIPEGTFVIPGDIANFITLADIPEIAIGTYVIPADIANFITLADIPEIAIGTYVIPADIANFITLADIPEIAIGTYVIPADIANFITLADIPEIAIGTYVIPADIANFITLADIPEIAIGTYVIPGDIANFITLADIPEIAIGTYVIPADIANFITLADIPEIPIGTYLIPADIVNFITLADIPEIAIGTYVIPGDIANFITLADIPEIAIGTYVIPADIANFITLADIPEIAIGTYVIPADIANFITLADIPEIAIGTYVIPGDIANFITLADIPEIAIGTYVIPGDIANFITLADIPEIPIGTYLIPADIVNFITLADIPAIPIGTYVIPGDIANFITLADIPEIPIGTYLIPADIVNFITLAEIPVQYNNAILEADLANKAGASIIWNNISKKFDLSIQFGTYAEPDDLTNVTATPSSILALLNVSQFDINSATGLIDIKDSIVNQPDTVPTRDNVYPFFRDAYFKIEGSQITLTDLALTNTVPNITNVFELFSSIQFEKATDNIEFIRIKASVLDKFTEQSTADEKWLTYGGYLEITNIYVEGVGDFNTLYADFNTLSTSFSTVGNDIASLTNNVSTLSVSVASVQTALTTYIADSAIALIDYTLLTKPSTNGFLKYDGTDWIINQPNYITLAEIPVQYNNAILEEGLYNKAGASIIWNNTTKKFDLAIPYGVYAEPDDLTNVTATSSSILALLNVSQFDINSATGLIDIKDFIVNQPDTIPTRDNVYALFRDAYFKIEGSQITLTALALTNTVPTVANVLQLLSSQFEIATENVQFIRIKASVLDKFTEQSTADEKWLTYDGYLEITNMYVEGVGDFNQLYADFNILSTSFTTLDNSFTTLSTNFNNLSSTYITATQFQAYITLNDSILYDYTRIIVPPNNGIIKYNGTEWIVDPTNYTYTAGNGISIINNIISTTTTVAPLDPGYIIQPPAYFSARRISTDPEPYASSKYVKIDEVEHNNLIVSQCIKIGTNTELRTTTRSLLVSSSLVLTNDIVNINNYYPYEDEMANLIIGKNKPCINKLLTFPTTPVLDGNSNPIPTGTFTSYLSDVNFNMSMRLILDSTSYTQVANKGFSLSTGNADNLKLFENKTEFYKNIILTTDETNSTSCAGITWPDDSVQITAPVQSKWNETDTNSLKYIENKPYILTRISASPTNDNYYFTDRDQLFRNKFNEDVLNLYENRTARFYGNITLADDTILTTAPVQSDWNIADVNDLRYIANKPSIGGGTDLNVDIITFNNQDGNVTGALIQGHTLKLKGLYEMVEVPGGLTYITEDFTGAIGATNAIMSGFNPQLFDNGGLGSDNSIYGSSFPYNYGQISGISGTNVSEIRGNGSGSGSGNNFTSASVGFSRHFCTNGNTNRSLRTKNISSILANAQSLSFWFIAGNQSNGGNYPETGENFDLQFLNSIGEVLTYRRIHSGGSTYAGVANFTQLNYTLTSLETAATYLRWFQAFTNTGNYDHYGVTGISLGTVSTTSIENVQQDIDVRLENLPTTQPTETDRLWKDSNGFLKIS